MDSQQLIRNTLSLSDLRSSSNDKVPIVENILSSLLPSGSVGTRNKALHYAFYNVIALIAAGASILVLWTVTCVLQPFIKSLLWALLCGSLAVSKPNHHGHQGHPDENQV